MSLEGRYMYSVVKGGHQSLGSVGIDGRDVYTIHHDGIAAVVHACDATPYDTKDNEKAKEWILAHGRVIDIATVEFGTVLPFPFDTIVKGGDEAVESWLMENHGKLSKALEKVRDRSEYSVQAFIADDRLEALIEKSMPEAARLKESITRMTSGSGYLMKRRYELMVKDAKAVFLRNVEKGLIENIQKGADDIKPERKPGRIIERFKGAHFVANVACLVRRDKVDALCSMLDRLEADEGLMIRLTGPWAPFSFSNIGGDDAA